MAGGLCAFSTRSCEDHGGFVWHSSEDCCAVVGRRKCKCVDAAHARKSGYCAPQLHADGAHDHGCPNPSNPSSTCHLRSCLQGQANCATRHHGAGRALLPHDARDRVAIPSAWLLESWRAELLSHDSPCRGTGDRVHSGPDSPTRDCALQWLARQPSAISRGSGVVLQN